MEIQRRVSNRRVSPGGGRPSAPWTTTHYLLLSPQRGWHGAGSGGPGRACSHFPPGGRRVGERGLGRTSGQLRTPCPGSTGRGAGWRLDSLGGSCVRGVGMAAASLQGGDMGCGCHSVKPQGEPVRVCCPGGRKGGVGRVERGVGSGPPHRGCEGHRRPEAPRAGDPGPLEPRTFAWSSRSSSTSRCLASSAQKILTALPAPVPAGRCPVPGASCRKAPPARGQT